MDRKILNLDDQEVTIASYDEPDMRLMKGRFIYNSQKKSSTFIEGLTAHKRSKELGRTEHLRCVQRASGVISFSIQFKPDEEYIAEKIATEVNKIMNKVIQSNNL